VTASSPLASGLLSGKYNADARSGGSPRRLDTFKLAELDERNLGIAGAAARVAGELGRIHVQ